MRASLLNRRPQTVWDFMNEVNSVFDQALDGGLNRKELLAPFQPAVDIEETSDYFLMSFDLPGIDKDQVKIDIHENTLSVTGERTRTQKTETENGFRQLERSYGRFERRFLIPVRVAADKIQARFENGVLEIMIPKEEVAKTKTIKIESGGSLFSRLIGKSESKKDEH